MNTLYNLPVNILSVGFGRDLRATPRTMEYDGRYITFVDNGVQTTIHSGEKTARIVTLSDGHQTYRLRSDNRGGIWTLLSIA